MIILKSCGLIKHKTTCGQNDISMHRYTYVNNTHTGVLIPVNHVLGRIILTPSDLNNTTTADILTLPQECINRPVKYTTNYTIKWYMTFDMSTMCHIITTFGIIMYTCYDVHVHHLLTTLY